MHIEVIKKKEVIHHLFWRVQKRAGVSVKSRIGTGWPIGLKLLGKDDSSTRTSCNSSIELRSLIGMIGLF
jgi:hypothetical protein